MSAVLTRISNHLSISPLHPLFVAEITGIDLTAPVARDDFRAIWDAFNEYQILVFRDQRFDDASQIAFSRNFGTLETTEAHAANNYKPGHIAVMTNLNAQDYRSGHGAGKCFGKYAGGERSLIGRTWPLPACHRS